MTVTTSTASARRAALATLNDLPYYRRNFQRVKATRQWLTEELTSLGFKVLPSESNFIFARPPKFPAKAWLEKLRGRKILARWFKYPETKVYLRITIGTDAEAKALSGLHTRFWPSRHWETLRLHRRLPKFEITGDMVATPSPPRKVEERAGERRRLGHELFKTPSLRLSPRSFLAGRER